MKIERDEFVKFMKHENTIELLFMGFEYLGDLFQTESFIFYNDCGGDVSIIDKYTLDREKPRIVNWYKLYHVGRCLNITGFEDMEDLEAWRSELNEELKDYLNFKDILQKEKSKPEPKSKTPDVNSLYPKLMLNSLYGHTGIPETKVFIFKGGRCSGKTYMLKELKKKMKEMEKEDENHIR